MAVSIRLKRMGKKKHPFYRIVVQDKEASTSGHVIEEIGTHDPMKNPPVTQWQEDRLKEWLQKGAIPTPTLRSLLIKHKLN